MPKVVCIDARMWGIAHTGIGRYIENLIDHLPSDSNIQIVLIVPPVLRNEPKLTGFTKYYARLHPYSPLAQFEMLALLARLRPDVLHVPHFHVPVLWPGRLVVTIHDLIKHFSKGQQTTTRHPLMYWLKYLGYLVIVWVAVHRASRILVPVSYWKDVLVDKYRLDPDKITVTYEGVTGEYLKQPESSVGIDSRRPFVIYTGNVYPHKNIPVLLAAIKLLEGQVNLAVSCARSVFVQRIEKLTTQFNLSKYVKFLGQVPDADLVSLYKQALAFVTPSLIEGFGLSGLEAMAAGTPVIAARASCLPEVYGEAALFFDPYSPADLAEKIRLLMTDPKLRQQYIKKGLAQVKKYSWSKMATQTWRVYQALLRLRIPKGQLS